MEEKFKAIILKKIKYSESDLIIHYLNSRGEKRSGIAKGALRSKKRFGGGVLEVTHYVQMLVQIKSENQLDLIKEAQIINDFNQLRSSYDRLQVAFYIINTVDKVSQSGYSHSEDLFNLLGHSLTQLEKITDFDKFKLHYQIRFLRQQGILEQEAWMRVFIENNILDHDKIVFDIKTNQKYLDWVNETITHYLTRAERAY